jgi:hypothetical protein
MSALERRLTSLERRPERLSWTICAVVALGTTVSLLVRVRSPRCRPALAVLLAPLLFVVALFVMGVVGINLGIVWP